MPILTGFGPHPRGPKSGQGKLADLDALSLGYQTTIAWITDLAIRLYDRYPDSPNPALHKKSFLGSVFMGKMGLSGLEKLSE